MRQGRGTSFGFRLSLKRVSAIIFVMGRPKVHGERELVPVRMPKILKAKLRERASKESVSMTELVVRFCREGLSR